MNSRRHKSAKMREIMCTLVVVLLCSKTIISTSEPCSTPSGYEKFITGVAEDTPVGTVIGILDVKGSNDEISLFQNTNAFLSLDITSRNITLQKELDTDRGDSTIILQVFCHLIASTTEIPITVRVILEDVNDNRPKFPRNHFYKNISEDTVVGTTVFSEARATDNDAPGLGNDQIFYSIEPGPYSDYFEIKYSAYPDITLVKSLDFETIPSMTITVKAEDSPSKGMPLSSTAFVTFNVLDVDDLNPQFKENSYFATINTGVIPGYIIPIEPPIEAEDGDKIKASIKYELVDPQNIFVIDENTAIVSVNAKLTAGKTTLVLKAIQRDNPLRQGIALLQLTIMEENTKKGPSFAQPRYHAFVSESDAIGTIVTTITALYTNQTVQYSTGNQEKFRVDDRGNIILTGRVDYEERRQYIFNITASDGIHTAWATVTITVADVNDNGPRILQRDITVSAERIRGAAITIVQAVDNDPNTTLYYSLLTHTRQFTISQSGEITITGEEEDFPLDEYTVVVSVKDDGKPQREAVSVVTVKFPKRPTPGSRTMSDSGNDLIAIILGIIAAILLIIIIFLIVYIIRRRQFVEEQLDKAKIRQGMDPRGLTYQRGGPSPDPSKMELHFDGELEETSEIDSSTTIQDNPLKYRYDTEHDVGAIQMETAVIPYDDNYNDFHRHSNGYQNTALRTFHVEDTSTGSDTSDSTGDSNKGLMESHKKNQISKGNALSWGGSSAPSSTFGSDGTLPEEHFDPKEKPEITVYF